VYSPKEGCKGRRGEVENVKRKVLGPNECSEVANKNPIMGEERGRGCNSLFRRKEATCKHGRRTNNTRLYPS